MRADHSVPIVAPLVELPHPINAPLDKYPVVNSGFGVVGLSRGYPEDDGRNPEQANCHRDDDLPPKWMKRALSSGIKATNTRFIL